MDFARLKDRLRQRVETTIRRTWMKYALRGVAQNDAHGRLDLAYRMPDPWKMESEQERYRFAETARRFEQVFGRTQSILEIGCGEGHQSEYFARLCDRLTGIDVSPTAVGRAKARLPQASFVAGDLYAQPWRRTGETFDVVVACEVLYYLSDVGKMLAEMDQLAKRGCLITYFAPAERKIGAAIAAQPGIERDSFRYGDVEWTIGWWKK